MSESWVFGIEPTNYPRTAAEAGGEDANIFAGYGTIYRGIALGAGHICPSRFMLPRKAGQRVRFFLRRR